MEWSVEEFVRYLVDKKFYYYTSVPCSILAPFIAEIDRVCANSDTIQHISSLREDISIGLACGASLTGKKAVVLMQNSGLGLSVNAIASLATPYKIPILLIISVRGYRGLDTIENRVMGNITESLLRQIEISSKVMDTGNYLEILHWATSNVDQGISAAILIPCNSEPCLKKGVEYGPCHSDQDCI